MKSILLGALALGLISTTALADGHGSKIQEGRGIVKSYFGALKGELVSSLKAGGPLMAIPTCNHAAPEIEKQTSAKSGWMVSRTSLKLRNQKNAPDLWETAVLKMFDERRAAGEDPMKMEHSGFSTLNGKKVFRYMKAIPTAAKPCLACHGKNIKPAVTAKLDDLYPGDKARGYKPGDVRGAFTLVKYVD